MLRHFTITRTVLALLAAIAFAAVSLPAASQPTNDEIETIREERREVQAAAAEKAKEVDAGADELELVTAALVSMQASVNAQEGRAADAQRQLVDAEIRFAESTEAVATKREEIVQLRELLAQRAIVSFVNQNDESVFTQSADASQAIRMQTLVDQVTQADVDVAELFRAAEEDLQIEEELANLAQIRADQLRVRAEEELALLEEEEEARAVLTAEAEERLERLLFERQSLAQLDASLGAKEQAAVDALAAELARKAAAAAAPAGGGGGGGGGTVSRADISNAGNGIWVHNSIVGNIQRLLADAAAAGVPLAGGGYRDPAGQIAVRKNNCGTSNYAIYEMPSSQCRPPTARPGRSMHEQGRAIDFTYNGRIIGRRSGPAWDWLKANAANYGLYNLPSEPWHWSTNGN